MINPRVILIQSKYTTANVFRVPDLNTACTQKCEEISLECIMSCDTNDSNCVSLCLRDITDCQHGLFNFQNTV